jgi:fatty-acid desaturase
VAIPKLRVIKTAKKWLKAPDAKEIRTVQFFAHLLSAYSFFYHPHLSLVGVAWGWLIAGLGGVLIGHRYVAHKQFEFPNPFFKYFFYYLYNLNTIGSAVNYANIHWLHHKHSDDINLDPTTWKRTGIVSTHFTFYNFTFTGKINLRQYKSLIKDSTNRFFHDYYYLPHIITLILLLPLGAPYVIVFLAIPAIVSFHIAQLQVGILHLNLPGSYRKDQTLEAYNIPWLKPLLFGEELHNNHHSQPNEADRGQDASISEYDPLYRLVIRPLFRTR